MSNYTAVTKKLREKYGYGSKTTGTGKTAQSQVNTQEKATGQSGYAKTVANLRKKYGYGGNNTQAVLESLQNAYNSEADIFKSYTEKLPGSSTSSTSDSSGISVGVILGTDYTAPQDTIFGTYDEMQGIQKERAASISNLRSRIELSRKYIGDETADAYLKSLDEMLGGYDTLLSMSQYDSQEAYDADVENYERYQDFYQKYEGKSYGELVAIMDSLAEDSEERQWLESYAPSVMTKDDYTKALQEAEDRLDTLHEYQSAADWYALYSSNPGAYSSDIYAEDVARNLATYEQYVAEFGGDYPAFDDLIEAQQIKIGKLKNSVAYNFLEEEAGYDQLSNTMTDKMADRSGKLKYMTDEEVGKYNYLYYRNGEDAAEKYLEALDMSLNARRTEKQLQDIEKYAALDFVLGGSVATSLVSGIGYLSAVGHEAKQELGQYFTGEYATPLDTNTWAYMPSRITSTVRGANAQALADATGTIQFDEQKNPVLAQWLNGKSLGDVYQLGMSMADSVAAGAIAKFGPISDIGGILLAGSAATSTLIDAVERGATDEEALEVGLIAGGIEYISEKASIGNLFSDNFSKNAVKEILKQGGIEASEEALTSIVNTIADAAIMTDKSNVMLQAKAYMKEDASLTEEEALRKAWSDAAIQCVWDAVGGFASGGVSAGARSTYMNVRDNTQKNAQASQVYGADPGALVGEALELDPENAFAQKMQSRVESGKSLSGRQLSKLVQQNENAITAQERETFQSNAQSRLTELGETGDVGAVASAIVKQATGEKLTASEKKTLTASKYGQQVAGELAETVNEQVSSRFAERTQTRATEAQKARSGAQTAQENVTAAQENALQDDTAETVEETEGQTFQKSTGKTIQVEDKAIFASIENGQATALVDGETTAAADDVSFGNEMDNLMFQTIARLPNMTTQGGNTIWTAYKSGQYASAAATFGRQAALTYRAGYLGDATVLRQGDSRTSALMQAHKEMIFREGRKAAAEHYRAQQEQKDAKKKADANKKATAKKGGVYYGYEGQTIDQRKVEGDHKKLTGAQKVGVDFVKRLSKKFGRTFYFYESYTDESGNRVYRDRDGNVVPAENGFYDPKDGSIHIDLNATSDSGEGYVLFTIAHELVHSIKEDSPKHFKQMADIVMEGFSARNVEIDKLIADRQAEAKERGRNITEDEAYEEVIAHALEGILSDGKAMDLVRMIEGKSKSLGAKIRQFFQDIAQMIRDTIDAYKGVRPESVEGRMILRMEDVYEKLQPVFAEGLYESGEHFRTAEKNTATDGGVKYSLVEFVQDGRRCVEIDQDQDRFDGQPVEKYPEIAKAIIKEKFENKVIGIDNRMFVNGEGRSEFAYPSKSIKDKGIYEAKMRASAELDNLLDAGTNFRNEPDGRDGHYHPDAVGGFDYFDTLFKIGDRFFEGIINIKNNKKGKLFKDVTKIKDVTQDIMNSYGENPKFQFLRTSSINSISKPSEIVKQNDSAKSGSVKNSVRRKVHPTVADMLRKENESLREDVARLKDLLKLQRTVTKGTLFRSSDVGHAANLLRKNNNATGNSQELVGLLETFYKYIAEGQDLTWENVREQAMPAVNWLQDHVKQERSEYAQDILNSLRGSRIYLDETQKAEAAHRFGSFNDFRKVMMGSIVIANDANMSLDSAWQELSGMYPDVFDPETNAADMPEALANIVDRLRNEDTSFMEYEYNRDMIQQDLVRQVYDSYWRVSTVKTYVDVMQAKINRIKSAHYQKVSELRAEYGEKIERIKAEHRAEVQFIRKAFRERMETQQKEITQHYQEARKRDVEGRKRTKMRNKIRGVVNELNQLLFKDEKVRHVPDNLKKAVAESLKLVDMDTIGVPERIKELNQKLAQLQKEMETVKNQERQQAIQAEMDEVQYLLDRYTKMSDRLMNLYSAYEEIANSSDPDIALAHDPIIAGNIKELAESIKDTAFKDMSMEQLEDVYSMYKMVLTRVRDANKTFFAGKYENIKEIATKVMEEVRQAGGDHTYRPSALDTATKFSWNNLKPVYALERIGSEALAEAFRNVRAGEDTWAVDVSGAQAYYQDKAKKYGHDSWDFDKKFQFTSASGKQFELSLSQMLSLYAYSKRNQAQEHLRLGGFVFDSNIETYKEKETNGKKRKSTFKYKVNTASAHQLSVETMAEIIDALSPEQRGFVDEMQDYLSTVMGAKGNEITMRMYGVKLFKEKFYFPLKSAKQFLFEQNEVAGEVRIKNSGFTNKVVARANNPVILRDFMDVWSDHVNDMSMYHAFVLPLEDFNRIFNYNSRKTDTEASKSVKGVIQNAYTPAAVDYVKQLITDLNGGTIADSREIRGWTAKFKKAKTFASLSVAIQQPSAIGRAFALVDPKYFQPTKDGMKHSELWSELKKYAPVAVIKEMGHFDTNMGRSTREFIQAKEYTKFGDKVKAVFTDEGYRDEALSKLSNLADELTWCAIWNAVKRETAANHSNLQPGSEEFLKTAGERFTEVVTKTQVYDSVLARSANMRAKGGFMGMLTSFMAEPTTTINMIEDALLKAKRGDGKYAGRVFASVMVSTILNNALVSLVYAMRDDDEDETFAEKYVEAFASGMIDDLNPITYYPFLKDLWSLLQGYDVERTDVSLFADAANAAKALIKAYTSENGDPGSAWWDLAGTVANIFGIPVENISRDIKGAINMVSTVSKDLDGRSTTWGSTWDTMQAAAHDTLPVVGWLPGESKSDKLYDAIVRGDAEYAERLKNSAKDGSLLSTEHYYRAVTEHNQKAADTIYEGLIADKMAEGYLRHEAEEAIASSFVTQVKNAYMDEKIGRDKARELLEDYTYKGNAEVKKWDFEVEHGFSWGERVRKYRIGELSESELISAVMDIEGESREDAQEYIKFLDLEMEHGETDITASDASGYFEYAEPAGIDIDVYLDYKATASTITGTAKKQRRMDVIHSLPLTVAQKDALYFSEGWSESTLHEAPWHN